MVTQSLSGSREYSVFYLKHAKAAAAAEILSEIFGGSSSDGMLGGLADAALGDIGGGLMGDLLGLGGGSSTGFSTGSVDIVVDQRLNALIVSAQPEDTETVYRLLKILDQRQGPTDVEAEGVARLIPVNNTTASQVAAVGQGSLRQPPAIRPPVDNSTPIKSCEHSGMAMEAAKPRSRPR